MTYTISALLGVVLAVALDVAVLRVRLLTRRAFWTAYAIIVFFQLITNGLLTGLDVVRYDPDRIVGLRIAYAPAEDLLFGFALVLFTLDLWIVSGRRAVRRRRPADR